MKVCRSTSNSSRWRDRSWGDEDDVAARHLSLLGNIGLGHAFSAIDDVPGPLREPGIETAIEGDRGEDRHDQRRDRGKKAEQRDDPHMKPGARQLLAPSRQQTPDLPGDQKPHQRNEDFVDRQEQNHDLA